MEGMDRRGSWPCFCAQALGVEMGKYQQHLFNIYHVPGQQAPLDLCPWGHSAVAVPERAKNCNCTPQPRAALGQTRWELEGQRINTLVPYLLVRAWSSSFPGFPWGLVPQVPTAVPDTQHTQCWLPSLPVSPTCTPLNRFLGSPPNKPPLFSSLLPGEVNIKQ